MAMTHVELTAVDRYADEVWEWVSDARNVLAINLFHEQVDWPEPITRAGTRVPVPHNFFGFHRERRGVTIRKYDRYLVSWGEYKLREEGGVDTFPHNQTIQILPVDDRSCVIMNKITGVYVWPVPEKVRTWAFRKFIPVILRDDNAVIAVAVGALNAEKVKKPLGLFLWPFMVAFGGRFIKRSSRTKIIQQAKSGGERKPAAVKPAVESQQPETAA